MLQSCVSRCGDYQTCVLCKVFGVTPANKTLCENCPKINNLKSLSELQALQLPTTCQETDDEGCTYYYSYEEKNNITYVYAVENKDCPEGPDVLLIVLAVIGGIVGIGIILLILWKLLTAMVVCKNFSLDANKIEMHRHTQWQLGVTGYVTLSACISTTGRFIKLLSPGEWYLTFSTLAKT